MREKQGIRTAKATKRMKRTREEKRKKSRRDATVQGTTFTMSKSTCSHGRNNRSTREEPTRKKVSGCSPSGVGQDEGEGKHQKRGV